MAGLLLPLLLATAVSAGEAFVPADVRAGRPVAATAGLRAARLCASGPPKGCPRMPADRVSSCASRREALLRALTAAGLVLSGQPALAERTFESMKKSKANYLPRLKTGVTFYEGVCAM
jgi:hypothetical protein